MERVRQGNNAIVVKILNAKKKTLIRDYSYEGYLPQVKQNISDMAMNGSGIRDTAWVLGISLNSVIDTLRKSTQTLVRK